MNKRLPLKAGEKTKAAIEKASLKAERNGWLQPKNVLETDLASTKKWRYHL